MDEHITEERRDNDAKASDDNRVPPLTGHERNAKDSHIAGGAPPNSLPKSQLETMPCGHTRGGRNLIVCIDGTANQFGAKNTNVIELYNLILKELEDNQCTWYNSGIGTYARPHWRSLKYWSQIVVHKVDLAIAWNYDKTVQGAYRWLSDNYQKGDCIFLFGFSRGACQIRSLSGMIQKVGLIYKGNEMQIPFAYELYADPKSDEEPAIAVGSTSGEKQVSMAARFKEAFSHKNVKVHFVGAWDTVSSIGIARGKRVLPLTTDGMTHVCYFRHALALDERRVKFLPEYAYGGTTLPPPNVDVDSKQNVAGSADRVHPQTLEVWFPGTHSDIGGGNANNAGMDRSRPPLRWMAAHAAVLGLRIGSFKRELTPKEQIEFQESLKGTWRLFEYLPFQRLTFARTTERINSTTRMPHRGSARKIHEGQKVHYSFILGETKSPYIPKARPQSEDSTTFWNDLRKDGLQNSIKMLDVDVFYRAEDAVKKLLARGDVLDGLKQMATDRTGSQFLYDEVIETLRSWDKREPKLELEDKCRFLSTMIDVFPNNLGNLKLEKWSQDPTLLSDVLSGDFPEYREVAQQFQHRFIKDVNCLFELRGHTDLVVSVAISPDGNRIVSGSWDETIRIWDAETGAQVGEPLQGHTYWVWSVAILPDGKHIVSGSGDNTIRIWDLESGAQLGEPLQEHTKAVLSVAISPDGKHIVSGSYDKMIRIWDAETRKQVGEPLRGHTEPVFSVAISPDGKHIVSGSWDDTIRVWNLETGVPVGEPLRGHTGDVNSVAISPDGKRIVSGSYDKTIRIWDLETGAQVGEPLRGHTSYVISVAISPDGKCIVSGSYDETIRIWNLETGAQVGEPLRGHTGWVRSVAISPDSKRIVSGSLDSTIRIWSAEGILD